MSGELGDLLERKLDLLEASPPISLDSVDLTIKNPAKLKQELGRALAFFHRVEGEVDDKSLLTLLPHLNETVRRFLGIWVPQEQSHSAIFANILEQIDQPPFPIEIKNGLHNRVAGLAGRLLPYFHDIWEMQYSFQGLVTEISAIGIYGRLKQRFNQMGETALAESMKPVRGHESGHRGIYKELASWRREHLSPSQLWLAREITTKLWTPVGAGSDKHKPHMGHVLTVLAGESIEEFAEPVQQIAQDLLSDGENILPPFVLKALSICIEKYHDEQLAVAA